MRQPTLNATAQSLVQRVWGYATVLRDDGVGYGDYVEQITYLLFLKMADEQAGAPNAPAVPEGKDWASLRPLEGDALEVQYRHLLTDLGKEPGMLGVIFKKAQNKIQNPARLKHLLALIDRENWSGLGFDVKGEIYEGLLQKNAEDVKGGAGQYFTPRPLIQAIVEAVAPTPGQTICDPACGTAGFLVEAYTHLAALCHTVQDRETLQRHSIYGGEAKPLPYLLAQMNLVLHGLDAPQISPDNSLAVRVTELGERDRVDVILTNPPFGGEEEGSIKSGFPADKQTSETALLFLQLIMRKLRRAPHPGRAAVVVPNGTLFGDGVAARIKEELLKDFNLHTIVRLPQGVFEPYTAIASNLLFFDRSSPTEAVWYYELPVPEGRKNYTKTKPLQYEEFAPCLAWWHDRAENEHAWRVPAATILANGCNLDSKNPHAATDLEHLPPEQLVESILAKEQQIAALLIEIKAALAGVQW